MDQRSALIRLAVVLLVSVAVAPAQGQVLISQQGVLRSAAGAGVDGTYEMLFTLTDSATSLNVLWYEPQPAVEVKNGAFNVVLGADIPIPPGVLTGAAELWLGVSVQGEPELPRRRVGTVAFASVAQYAATAAALSGPIESLECSGCIDATDLAPGAVTTDKIALGAVQAHHVAFAFAGAAEPGGPAALALDVDCEACVELGALSFVPATLADVEALGPSLESLGCTVGQTPWRTAAGWGCADAQITGLSSKKANGFELLDSFGYAWDGFERPAATWAVATATCAAAGGRLPTVGELYRNRSNSPTGIGQSYQGNWLWTMIARDVSNTMIVRMSDGSTTHSNIVTKRQYRCVWSDEVADGFAGDHCLGGCWAMGEYNWDSLDRPAMPLMPALRECAAHGARVAELGEIEAAIRGGLPNGTKQWVWTGDQYKSTNTGAAFLVVAWDKTNVAWFPPQKFSSGNAYGVSWPSDSRVVRCVGYADRSGLVAPQGGFVGPTGLVGADEADRASIGYLDGVDVCRDAGGHLVRSLEGVALLLAGWAQGSGDGIWTAEHGDLPLITLYWTDTAETFWPPNALAGQGQTGFGQAWYESGTRPERCVFYARRPDWTEPEACNGGCFVLSNGGRHVAIDKEDRIPATYFDAVEFCGALGARLPITRDLEELIRQGAPSGSGVGVWTQSSHVSLLGGAAKIIVRWLGIQQNWSPPNGLTNSLVGYNSAWPGEPRPYRCLWSDEVN